MNNIQKALLSLLMGSSLITFCYFPGDKLWHGVIKFPSNAKIIPPVRVYYGGHMPTVAIDDKTKQISFDISESQIRTVFPLIITDRVDFKSEKNTPQYLKVPANQPYKMYILEYVPDTQAIKDLGNKIDADKMGSWRITQENLDSDRRIPDNAITVYCYSRLVKTVEGGNGLDLPKIIIDADVLAQLTTEELQDTSARILLSSLDTDTIHSRQTTNIKPDFAKKNIVAMICS